MRIVEEFEFSRSPISVLEEKFGSRKRGYGQTALDLRYPLTKICFIMSLNVTDIIMDMPSSSCLYVNQIYFDDTISKFVRLPENMI